MLATNGQSPTSLLTLSRVYNLVDGLEDLKPAELKLALEALLARLSDLPEDERNLPLIDLREKLQPGSLPLPVRQQLMHLLQLLLVTGLLLDSEDLKGLLDLLSATLSDDLLTLAKPA